MGLAVVFAATVVAPDSAAGALRAKQVVPRVAVAGAALGLRAPGSARVRRG
jgi:hypothetical protein